MVESSLMIVTLNGEERGVPDGMTVRELLDHLSLSDGPVAVEINRGIVPRAEHASRPVEAGDSIEIVHLVGGG
jgi:thiamine biosynthesis protein ThiS